MPPTITVASGRCTWLPMPVEMAAGSRPMAGGEDLSLAGASDREGAFVNRSGVDQLIKGDRDLGAEHHIDFVICWIDVYYEGS